MSTSFMLMQVKPARQAIWNNCRVGNLILNQSNAALLDMLLTNPNCGSFRKAYGCDTKPSDALAIFSMGPLSPWHRMTKKIITQACKCYTQMITFGSKNILTAISNHTTWRDTSGTLKCMRSPTIQTRNIHWCPVGSYTRTQTETHHWLMQAVTQLPNPLHNT